LTDDTPNTGNLTAPQGVVTPPVAKSPDATQDQLKLPAMPTFLNNLGHVKAGYVLKMMDIAAVLPVMRHLGPGFGVVTAAVDRTNFIAPIRRWEIITLDARLTQVWTSSAETEVVINATSYRTGEVRLIAKANIVMVGLDKRRKKCVMPPLLVTTPGDIERRDSADKRKQLRQVAPEGVIDIPINPLTDDPVSVNQPMTLQEANLFNQVFGGVVLELLETAGRTAAKRHVLGSLVEGVRLDRMSFLTPAFIGETLQAYGVVTQTWLTSMEVQVEVFAFNERLPQPRKIAEAYLIYVGLDPDGNPTVIPQWQPMTAEQEARVVAANVRRTHRKNETT
jgi:acyl-CoA hydrolase